MKPRAWMTIARGVVLDSMRRKDLWVVAILGALVVGFAGALGLFGFDGLEVFAKDLAVTVVGLFSTVLTAIAACRVLPDEIRNRTLYPLLARPISRFDLLMGKFLGVVAVSWAAFLILSLLAGLALSFFGVGWETVMAQYLAAKMMGLALLCAVGIAFSAYVTQQAAVTLTLLLSIGSSVVTRALLMAYGGSSSEMQWLFKALHAALPQFSLFDFGGRVAYVGWSPAPAWVLGALAAYAAAYSAAMLALSWARFRRQAV